MCELCAQFEEAGAKNRTSYSVSRPFPQQWDSRPISRALSRPYVTANHFDLAVRRLCAGFQVQAFPQSSTQGHLIGNDKGLYHVGPALSCNPI